MVNIVIDTKQTNETTTIDNGETTSGVIDVDGYRIAGIDVGTPFNNTLFIYNSIDGIDFKQAVDNSGAVSWNMSGGYYFSFNPPLEGYKFIKFTTPDPVDATVTLTLVLL